MKLHKLLLSLFAGAALFAGCATENPVNDPDLAVDVNPSILPFGGKTAGEAEVEVSARAAWTATVPADADWLTVTPASGGTGVTKVKVAVLAAGEDGRTAEVVFKAAGDSKILTVQQEGGIKYGTKETPYPASKAYDWVAGKPADAKTDEVYIKGIICKITAPYVADNYGNAHFYISDDGKDGDKVFQCYRCLYITPEGAKEGVKYSDPTARNISVGDEVVVYGKCVNYKGNTPETVQNEAWLISLEAGSSPVLSVASPALEILADATEAKFAVEAKNLSKWTVAAKETYDWVTDFTKEGTTSGDITVTVKANTATEARTAVFTVSADGVDPVELTLTQKGASMASTVAEITAQITSKDRNNPSAYSANLKGAVVSYVNGGNAYIEDESGAILLFLSNHGLEPGKKISGVVKGTGYLYNGLPEITAIGSEATIADGGTIPQTEMTIADLLANYAPNYSRRILLKGVTVKDAIADGDRSGAITQNGAEIAVYAGLNNKGLVLTEGATGDFICFPTVYVNSSGTETKQLSFWDNSLFTAQAPSGPVTIKTAAEFAAWAKDNADKDATLAADITLPADFAPASVTGNFDGGNKTITVSNLAGPVFASTTGAVKNVNFAGSFAAADATAKLHLAPIGKSTGAIENVINKATVTYTGIAPEAAAGVTVAGIVCEAYGPVKNCKNQAKVSANGSGKDTWGLVVAGIIGFAGAAIEDCENSGEISLVAGSPLGRSTGMTEVTMKYNPCPAASGIVAYAVSDDSHAVSVSRCTNSAKVTMTYDALTESSFDASRTGATGIVSAGGCPIANCTNTGDIYFNAYGASRGTAIAKPNIILHPAGIHGSDYYVKVLSSSPSTIDQDETTITDCTNSGNIYVDSDCTKSNSAVGGISGWPGAENAATVVSKISNCNNSGSITISGLIKVRVGGIAGGTSSIEGCKTTGDILINGADATSVAGLINGFHTQFETLKNCEASGKVESKVKINGVAGLCGGIGNVKNTFGENCKVNAQLIGGATEQVGLVVGHLNGDTQAVTVGTETEPVLVKGSVNGVAITADNFSSYIHKASKYKEGIHVFNVKFDSAN